MPKTISTMEVRQGLGDLLNRVALRHDEFIVERKGVPLAAIIPVEKMALIQEAALANLKKVARTKRDRMSQKEADQLADEAKHASRK